NTFDSDPRANPEDHPDHRIIESLFDKPGFWSFGKNRALFLGNALLDQPPNLTQTQHDQKIGLFSAYYFTVLDLYSSRPTELCAASANEQGYAAALHRQYLTRVIPE